MTNYLTSVGVQQVSITIANGNLTGTATINAVGSGAFIIAQGTTPTDTAAQFNDTSARVELTNSTTVTATRGATGTSQSVVVNAVVIDGDTTNLIKSVQSGTISITNGNASNTATISAVTNNNTAVHYLGQSYTSSNPNASQEAIVSLSGTTVTANLTGTSVGTTIVGYCIIEFQGAALNSTVQSIAYNATENVSSKTQTITSVNTNNTILIYGGARYGGGGGPANGQMYAQLTNATTVTLTWNTAANILRKCNLSVVEFASGVLNQAVQRGTIALSAATSNTATITSSSTANGFVNWLYNSSDSTSVKPEVGDYKITQTDPTTLTMTSDGAATGTGSYEVIEFPAFVSSVVPIYYYHLQQQGIA